jgi:hypothetical protein
MTMISHLNQVNDLLAEERMMPLKCPSAVTVAAAQIACAHGMAVKKMRGSMGSPQGGGNAPGSNDTGTEHEAADFFIFEDDKENIDPSTGVSARASSGTTSARGARPADAFPPNTIFTLSESLFCQTSRAHTTDPYRALPSTADEFEVAFRVPRDPARCAEAAVGAPSRQPLADVTAKYVTPAVRTTPGHGKISPRQQQPALVLPPAPFFLLFKTKTDVGRARENARIAPKPKSNR